MSSRDTIRDVATLVDRYGGTAAFAAWAQVGPSCVSNWKANNSIPRGYHLRLFLEARRRGLIVDADLFGVDPELFEVSAA